MSDATVAGPVHAASQLAPLPRMAAIQRPAAEQAHRLPGDHAAVDQRPSGSAKARVPLAQASHHGRDAAVYGAIGVGVGIVVGLLVAKGGLKLTAVTPIAQRVAAFAAVMGVSGALVGYHKDDKAWMDEQIDRARYYGN